MNINPLASGCNPTDPFIELQSGCKWRITNPNPADIVVSDIASALSKVCRFGGHVKKFYSVAQHCVVGAELLLQHGYSKAEAFQFLMHDASEAYLVDMPRPIKRILPGYGDLEAATEKAIAERFHLPYPMTGVTKLYDNRMLVTEQRDLMPEGPSYYPEIMPFPVCQLDLTETWTPDHAEMAWLIYFEELSP